MLFSGGGGNPAHGLLWPQNCWINCELDSHVPDVGWTLTALRQQPAVGSPYCWDLHGTHGTQHCSLCWLLAAFFWLHKAVLRTKAEVFVLEYFAKPRSLLVPSANKSFKKLRLCVCIDLNQKDKACSHSPYMQFDPITGKQSIWKCLSITVTGSCLESSWNQGWSSEIFREALLWHSLVVPVFLLFTGKWLPVCFHSFGLVTTELPIPQIHLKFCNGQ